MCIRYISPDTAAIERHWHIGRDDAWCGEELFARSLGPSIRAARAASEAERARGGTDRCEASARDAHTA
jgi:hypothetical protein